MKAVLARKRRLFRAEIGHDCLGTTDRVRFDFLHARLAPFASPTMPHSTSPDSNGLAPALGRSSTLKPFSGLDGDSHGVPEKFPIFDMQRNGRSSSPLKTNGHPNGPSDRWHPRRDDGRSGGFRRGSAEKQWDSTGHSRQKSLSDAIRTIRTRRGSVSQNAHEIADALKAPVSPKLIV